MNKAPLFFLLLLVATMGLVTTPNSIHADSQLDILIKIALNTKEHIKADLDKITDAPKEAHEQFDKGVEEFNLLVKTTEEGDVVSARQHFVSAMVAFKKTSMATETMSEQSQDTLLPDRSQTIMKYENNIKKLKIISDKLNADINFDQIDQLLALAKTNYAQGDFAQNEQILGKIATVGLEIHKSLYEISEQSKIYRAQHFAKKHAERINDLILQAKEVGLYETANKLEESKVQLLQANSTQIIKQQFKITIIYKQKVDQAKEIHQNKLLKFSAIIDSLENKAVKLADNVEENTTVDYFLNKAFKLIEDVRSDIKDLEYAPTMIGNDSKYVELTFGNKIKAIEDILMKVERLLYISS